MPGRPLGYAVGMSPTPAPVADLDRIAPDGGQRAPGASHLVRSAGTLTRRLPGMALATVRWARGTATVTRALVDCDGRAPAPDADRALPGDERSLLRRSRGRGRTYRRLYAVLVDDPRVGPEELVRGLLHDPNRASPTEVAVFHAASADREVGAEMVVRMPGPWDAPVRVVERTPTSFRLATLRGHMEAGEIEFRASDAPGGRLLFEIESWTRSGDRLFDLLYDKVPVAREMQTHMWVEFCRAAVRRTGGHAPDGVTVTTWRWKRG
jgi:hypothetical protein